MKKSAAILVILLTTAGLHAQAAEAPRAAGSPRPVLVLTISSLIDPISARYLERGIARAADEGDGLVVVELDTPGGLSVSMDQMVKAILSSKVPVAVLVAPRGARAASAGVFITMAAHVAAMEPGTHIGAAHPVAGGGADIPGAEGQKVLNDAAAELKSLAQLRGRSTSWADEAVRQSFSLTESEALAQHVVDCVVTDLPGLLSTVNGKTVTTSAGTLVLSTDGAEVRRFDPTLIDRILAVLVNPDLAYVLLVIGIFGIIFELAAPGIGGAGIAGVIAILLSLVGFGSLPTNLGGFIFIAGAVVLFIVDIKAPSHGVWTAGGIVSFVLGSFLLFPPWRAPQFPAAPEIHVSVVTIIVMTVLISLFFIFVISKGLAAQTRRVTFGVEAIPAAGEAVTDLDPDGQVQAGGERWSAKSADGHISRGEAVEVTGREGLTLIVKKRRG